MKMLFADITTMVRPPGSTYTLSQDPSSKICTVACNETDRKTRLKAVDIVAANEEMRTLLQEEHAKSEVLTSVFWFETQSEEQFTIDEIEPHQKISIGSFTGALGPRDKASRQFFDKILQSEWCNSAQWNDSEIVVELTAGAAEPTNRFATYHGLLELYEG